MLWLICCEPDSFHTCVDWDTELFVNRPFLRTERELSFHSSKLYFLWLWGIYELHWIAKFQSHANLLGHVHLLCGLNPISCFFDILQHLPLWQAHQRRMLWRHGGQRWHSPVGLLECQLPSSPGDWTGDTFLSVAGGFKEKFSTPHQYCN